MASSKEDARRALDEQTRSIDTLHQKLASVPGVDTTGLDQAVQTFKTAQQTFYVAALGCMNKAL